MNDANDVFTVVIMMDVWSTSFDAHDKSIAAADPACCTFLHRRRMRRKQYAKCKKEESGKGGIPVRVNS